MNITWNVTMPLKPASGLSVKVTPNDQWKDVKLSGTKQRVLTGDFRANITTKDGKVFKDIPRNWYMIEN